MSVNLNNFKVTVIPIPLIIFVAIISVIVALTVLARTTITVSTNTSRVKMEWAYFQGQKDALEGNPRIKYNESSRRYSWQRSCWDDGTKPIFNPAISQNPQDFR